MDCVFCKIVAGEIPGAKVYETDEVLAFLDINPVHPGHTLVIPKKHYANIEEAPAEVLSQVISAVKKVGLALKIGLNYQGYNVTENNDPVAGQLIAHLHFHVIPRFEGDGLKLWPQRQYSAGELEATAEKLKKVL